MGAFYFTSLWLNPVFVLLSFSDFYYVFFKNLADT